jgi:glycosyltransferase involved in cell wall biosynthesis
VAKWFSRVVMRAADRLVTNSYASLREIVGSIGVPASRVTVLHHGVPDPYGALPEEPRDPLALTVAVIVRSNVERKGLRRFVAAAAHAPEIRFVVVGAAEDAAAAADLRAIAADNVEFAGRVSDEDLHSLYRKASTYVQVSRHEGFGLAVAEAMLAGCIPVVSRAGALPEVVGDAGRVVDPPTPANIAAAVQATIVAPLAERARTRERVLREFPLERRRTGLSLVFDDVVSRRAFRARSTERR